MEEQRRVNYLILIMVFITTVAIVISFSVLYRIDLKHEEELLTGIARSEAFLVESTYKHVQQEHATEGDRVEALVLELVCSKRDDDIHHGFGDKGGIIIGRQEDNGKETLMQCSGVEVSTLSIIDSSGVVTFPMQLALDGQSGIVTGKNNAGEKILVSYEPVAGIDWGVVAVMNLLDLRQRYINAGIVVGLFVILVIVVGVISVRKLISPVMARLEESEIRFRTIFERAGVGVSQITTSGRYISINPLFCEITGYTREELQQMNFRDITHPDDIAYDEEHTALLLAGKIDGFNSEKRYVKKDGSIVWVRLTVSSVKDRSTEEISYFIVVVEDVTDWVHTRRALHTEMEFSKKLIDSAQAIVMVLDMKAHIVSINPFMEELSGYKESEVRGKEWFSTFLPEQDQDQIRELFLSAIDDMDVRGNVNSIVLKDGSTVFIEWYSKSIKGTDGETMGLLNIGHDVTSRLEGEAEREQFIRELEDKNAELERFTYTVSHDLKSPLITIQGFLGLLERDAVAGNQERLKKDINYITGAVKRMKTLLDELLELSRIGRIVSVPENIAFNDLVAEALASVSGRVNECGVDVRVEPDMPVVFGDKMRLREVVENLIDNAAKFTCNQPDARIEIGCRQEADGAVFFVKDNGQGIDPRYHEKVFGLFEKLDQGTDGSGVGLAIVKRIVELHGGKIWVESKGIGQGTTFCFTIQEALGEKNMM